MESVDDIFINTKKTRVEDFDFLRSQGIDLIQKLSGKVWTDYNTHDPGITLMEAFCYALTDLGYRTSFPIEDLLTGTDKIPFFYTARQVLNAGPVTILDFRKIIIDVEGVKNAWIEISDDYEVPLYLERSQSTTGEDVYVLGYEGSGGEPLRLKGLYKVVVELEESNNGQSQEDVLQRVRKKIQQHRNLCEDVITVSSVEYEPFTIEADIQVNEGADIEKISALIYQLIQNLFAPTIQFYTLQQMQDKGYTMEEIFEGPALQHGFIDAAELARGRRSPNVHLSDIINSILKIEGVIAIKSCSFPAGSQSSFSEFTESINMEALPSEKIVRLDIENSVIQFYRSGDKHRGTKGALPSKDRVMALYKFLLSQKRTTKLKGPQLDLPVNKGQDMNVGDYYPFQNNLPACYGTSEPVMGVWPQEERFQFNEVASKVNHPLPPVNRELIGDLPLRKKQALQLKGYLLAFEQIMADYLAQLENISEIFSFDADMNRTYFSQSLLERIPDALLLVKDREQYGTLMAKWESQKTFFKRRESILDHLLARFGEEMNKFSFYVHNSANGKIREVIRAKANFLQDYVQLGAERSRGFDYTDRETVWNASNVAGVKKRIFRLLGMENYNSGFTTCDWILIEKREEQNNPIRYVVVVRDSETKTVLLESRAYETESEVRHIMSYIIQNGLNKDLYSEENKQGHFEYRLKMETSEKEMDTIASMVWKDKESRDEQLSGLIRLLNDFGSGENFHMLEHILLRPKVDPHPSKPHQKPAESTSVSLLEVLEKPKVPLAAKNEQKQFPYKFRIDRKSEKGKLFWTLNLMRDIRNAALIVEESFHIKKASIERIVHIRQAGADRVNYEESQNADGYSIFVIKEKDRILARSKKAYREKKEMDEEISMLIDFFSYQLNLMKSATEVDEVSEADLADPYSLNVSIFIPDWPLRFREPAFKYLLEKAIYNELPSHIFPSIYWLDYKMMKDFENVYKPWLEELSMNGIPDISRVNSLVAVCNEIRKMNEHEQ